MGIVIEKCHLRIINASKCHALTLVDSKIAPAPDGDIINSWRFPSEIKSGSCSTVCIELCLEQNKGFDRCSKRESNDDNDENDDHVDADAVYSIGDTGNTFSIQIKKKKKCNYAKRDQVTLQLDWSDVWKNNSSKEAFSCLPPPLLLSSSTTTTTIDEGAIVNLGWRCNGTIIMTLASSFKETKRKILDLNLFMSNGALDEDGHTKPPQQNPCENNRNHHKMTNVSSSATTHKLICPQQKSSSLLSYFVSSSLPTLSPSPYTNWMETYASQIQNLPLTKLCLIETHNAATSNMKTFVASPWASNQKTSIMQQLHGGVRVLDLRIGCCYGTISDDENDDAKNDWPLVHDKWLTTSTLRDVLNFVCEFATRHTKEVVILDFHRFVPLSRNSNNNNNNRFQADLNKMIQFVTKRLGDLLYRNPGYIPTLKEIWNASSTTSTSSGGGGGGGGGRVIVAWNTTYPNHDSFFQGVLHGWYQNVTNKIELKNAIDQHLLFRKKKQPNKQQQQHHHNHHNNNGVHRLWTVGAVIPAFVLTPLCSIPELKEEWFIPGTDWMNEVNILQTDFSIEIGIVENAISQCLINAATTDTDDDSTT